MKNNFRPHEQFIKCSPQSPPRVKGLIIFTLVYRLKASQLQFLLSIKMSNQNVFPKAFRALHVSVGLPFSPTFMMPLRHLPYWAYPPSKPLPPPVMQLQPQQDLKTMIWLLKPTMLLPVLSLQLQRNSKTTRRRLAGWLW